MIHRLLSEIDSNLGNLTIQTFLNERGRDEETPLHRDCKCGEVEAAKALMLPTTHACLAAWLVCEGCWLSTEHESSLGQWDERNRMVARRLMRRMHWEGLP